MKKKIFCLTGGICGVLLIVSLILTVIPAAKTYNESGNLLVLRTEDDITSALDATGIPHSAEEAAPGVWEIRSRHELIPMLHELMKDEGDVEPVYEAAQGTMFTVIMGIWLIVTAACIALGVTQRNRIAKITAYSLAFLASAACPAVLTEVVCRIPGTLTLPLPLILSAILALLCTVHAILITKA